MAFEKNTNQFLTNDGFYRQQLSSVKDSGMYYKDRTDSEIVKDSIALAGLVAATSGTALAFYKYGSFQKFMSKFLTDFANSEGAKKYTDASNALREITERQGYNAYQDVFDTVHNSVLQKAVEKGKTDRAKKDLIFDTEFIRNLTDKDNALETLRKQGVKSDVIEKISKQMGDVLNESHLYDVDKNVKMMKQIGLREAKIKDLVDAKKLSATAIDILRLNKDAVVDAMEKVADRNIMVNMAGDIVDFRDSLDTIRKMGLSTMNDFQVPILGLNPLKMFHVDSLIEKKVTTMFHVIGSQEIQPYIAGTIGELKSNYVFIGGDVVDTITGKTLKSNMALENARGGMFAINTRRLAGIKNLEKTARYDNPVGHLLFKIAKRFDIGMQDEVYKESLQMMAPGTWLPWMSQKIDDITSPNANIFVKDISKSYGKGVDNEVTKYLVMNKSKGIKEEGFIKQLFAGRKNLEDVTKTTHVPYMLMERMNASLNAFRLGLGPDSIGSVVDVFKGLMTKRIVPVVVAIGAIAYGDYLLEDKKGYGPKDAIADTYVTASVNMAATRDKLGVTGDMKRLKNILSGWDQLEAIPIIGGLFSTKTKEETEAYWKEGEDPVRKGRYWGLGNTPYTGARTEYFRPNWVRRAKSDYKYTDTMYGSKKEFFQNSWMPTPTHPFAPVKHFLLDPYHYDKKHEKDRPYPITGGINELREIPIVGGVLDATIGRILKPRKKMHLEYWDGERLLKSPSTEDSPFQNDTRPNVSMSGRAGMNGIPISKQGSFENITYTTSSGNITIMAKPIEEDIKVINEILKKVSIKKAGGGSGEVRTGSPMYGEQEDQTIMPLKPGGLGGALENTYGDLTELAGFYGFSFTTLAGEGRIKRPRVQDSGEISSYSRNLWEKNLGGFGGEVSEIFRRFAQKKSAEVRNSELNPIRNTMPSWMPGKEYYIDYLHGDPYIKANEGEYRLPGSSYEVMNNIDTKKLESMSVDSNIIGKEETDIAKRILNADSMIDVSDPKLLSSGKSWRKSFANHLIKEGAAISVDQPIEDKVNNITGTNEMYSKHDLTLSYLLKDAIDFKYYKASDGKKGNSEEGYFDKIDVTKMTLEQQQQFFKDILGASKNTTVNVKNMRTKDFKEDDMKLEEAEESNFNASQMRTGINYVIHVNMDDDKHPIKVFGFEYNQKLLEKTVDKVQKTRADITTLMNQGILNHGDLYSYFDRFKILADTAPYSENFRFYDRLMSQIHLDDKQTLEVAEIRSQVSERKQPMRLYPYKFRNANLKHEEVTVKEVLDNGTVLVNEYEDNPIKLAGLTFSKDMTKPEGKASMDYLRKRLKQGDKIDIGFTEDDRGKVERDTYRTIKATVTTKGGNLNKQMIEKKYAKENESDDSAAGIHTRFSSGEIVLGKAWEFLSHRDSFFHTKFMQTRSALEMYKRRDLYGKDWQEWTHPVKDFLIPTMQNNMSKGIIWGTFMGAVVGSLFGRNRYGRIVGAALGGSIMFAGSTAAAIDKAFTGAYIPKRREKERSLNEYVDVLKYVKNRRLYDQYRSRAIKQEHQDPEKIIKSNKEDGAKRKARKKLLMQVKRDLHTKKITLKQAEVQSGIKATDEKEFKSLINGEITTITNFREVNKISPLAAQAIMYYNESEKTAYGYDSGEPISNMLYALNRKERKYLQPFLSAPESERKEILAIVPKYMKRALQAAYGEDVDKKPELAEYFKEHSLPGKDWTGWNPEVDLEDVKVKMVKHEGMDMSEFDYWNDDEERASHLDIPVPSINYHQKASEISRKLRDVLGESGLHDINVQVDVTHTEGISMDVDVENDRSAELEGYVRNYGVN